MSENIESGKVIITAKFNENGMASEEYKEYSKRSTANGEAHGGVVRDVFMIEENLGQGETPSGIFIIDFPSKEKAKAAFSSDEYKSILQLREVAFKEVKILLSK